MKTPPYLPPFLSPEKDIVLGIYQTWEQENLSTLEFFQKDLGDLARLRLNHLDDKEFNAILHGLIIESENTINLLREEIEKDRATTDRLEQLRRRRPGSNIYRPETFFIENEEPPF